MTWAVIKDLHWSSSLLESIAKYVLTVSVLRDAYKYFRSLYCCNSVKILPSVDFSFPMAANNLGLQSRYLPKELGGLKSVTLPGHDC